MADAVCTRFLLAGSLLVWFITLFLWRDVATVAAGGAVLGARPGTE
jgi:hypothetical protein